MSLLPPVRYVVGWLIFSHYYRKLPGWVRHPLEALLLIFVVIPVLIISLRVLHESGAISNLFSAFGNLAVALFGLAAETYASLF